MELENFSPGAVLAAPGVKDEKLTATTRNLWRIASVCFFMLIVGGSDATPGALLPTIENYYGISYGVVSMIWIGNALGFISIAFVSFKLDSWFGHRTFLLVGCSCSLIMYSIVLSGTKFPALVVGFFFGGAGVAMVLSKSNVFISQFENLSTYLSIAQSCFGFGATLAPLIATSVVGAGLQWHYFYLILLGLIVSTLVLFFFSFAKEEDLALLGDKDDDKVDHELLKLALKTRITWSIALFTFFYQGAEVAIGGWIVTYLETYRGAGHKVGYVSSGFWGGVALGRLFLTRPLYSWIGPHYSVVVCSVVSMVLVGLTWAVSNVIAESIFVSIAGLFVGPNYPTMLKLAAELFPRKIQIISLTITTAFGSSGGAFFPFMVGMLSQKFGTYVVLPSFLGLYAVMLVAWFSIPRRGLQHTSTI